MVRPSGLTSSDIQVPSSVSNSTVRAGPWTAATSHRAGAKEREERLPWL
jgi:hypothetical protein